jgi:acetyl-CoA C-acetyltransferase
MNISANTTLEVLSNLAPAFAQMGDLLFDQTAIDKYLAIEK